MTDLETRFRHAAEQDADDLGNRPTRFRDVATALAVALIVAGAFGYGLIWVAGKLDWPGGWI